MMVLFPTFLTNALVAGIALALLTGPLGSFMIWRRMSFLGDTIAHATLLGIAIAATVKFSPLWGMISTALIVGCVLVRAGQTQVIAEETWLAILAHGTLALGLVMNGIAGNSASLTAFIFGDILALNSHEVAITVVVCLLLLACVITLWPSMVLVALQRDLAVISGLNVIRLEFLMMLILSACLAMASMVIGVMLVTALMIIPAATAHRFAKSPEQMAIGASVTSILCVIGGLALSMVGDVPAAPGIIVVALAILLMSRFKQRRD